MGINNLSSIGIQEGNIIGLPNGQKAGSLEKAIALGKEFEDTFCNSSLEKRYVRIDGKNHSARKIDGGHVLINGRKYKVHEVADNIACDKTKEIVFINGKQYTVKEGMGNIASDLTDDLTATCEKFVKGLFKKEN